MKLPLAFTLFCCLFLLFSEPSHAKEQFIPGPIHSPPLPSSDWDGGPIIGEPSDDTKYPLQNFLGLDKDLVGIRCMDGSMQVQI